VLENIEKDIAEIVRINRVKKDWTQANLSTKPPMALNSNHSRQLI